MAQFCYNYYIELYKIDILNWGFIMNTKFKSLALILALTTATTQPMLQAIKNACYGKAAAESRGLGLKRFFTPSFKLFTPQFMQKAIKNNPYFVLGATLFGVGLAVSYVYKKYFAPTIPPHTAQQKQNQPQNQLSEKDRAELIDDWICWRVLFWIADCDDCASALDALKNRVLKTDENGNVPVYKIEDITGHSISDIKYSVPLKDILKHKRKFNNKTLLEMAQQQHKPEIFEYIQGLYKQYGLLPQETSTTAATTIQSSSSATATSSAIEKKLKTVDENSEQALHKIEKVLQLVTQRSTEINSQSQQQPQQASSSAQGQEQATQEATSTTATTIPTVQQQPTAEAIAVVDNFLESHSQQQSSSSSQDAQLQAQTETTFERLQQIRKIATAIDMAAHKKNLKETKRLIQEARTAGILDGVKSFDNIEDQGGPLLKRYAATLKTPAGDEVGKLYIPKSVTIEDIANEMKYDPATQLQRLIVAAEKQGDIVAMLKHCVGDIQTPYLKHLAQQFMTYEDARNIILALYEKYKDQLK